MFCRGLGLYQMYSSARWGGGGGLRKLTHFLKRFEATAFCMPIIQQVWPLSPAVRLTDCMRQGGEWAGKGHESFITSSILCIHTWLSSAKKGSFPFKLSPRFQRVSFLLEMWLRKKCQVLLNKFTPCVDPVTSANHSDEALASSQLKCSGFRPKYFGFQPKNNNVQF